MTLSLLLTCLLMPPPPAPFREHTVATDLKGGYQVLAADLNHDGKPDLLALASGLPELVWFENPSWERHVIAPGRSRMINAAVADTEIVLAEEFSMTPSKSAGIVSVLRPGGDPRRPWSVTEIDRLPSSHRLRWARLEGGRALINAPLAGAAAEPPDYKAPVPLVLYRPGTWKRELISDSLSGVLHGIHILDWDGDGHDEILTASFEGIHLFDLEGGQWRRTRLAGSAASDVAVGQLGRRRFLCSIEPWHGNQVVVYTEDGGAWRRQVIDDSFVGGHALATADLDRDGRDEIIAGYRGKEGRSYIYTADGANWTRRPLDAAMGGASCAIADLNGDGRLDIACIDSPALKWYENAGR